MVAIVSTQPNNEEQPKGTARPADVVETVIGGKRISEMTADELVQAVKNINLELARRRN